MEVSRFFIKDIERIEDGLFVGKLEVAVPNLKTNTANVVTIRVRTTISSVATISEIEDALFQAARDHLSQVGRLFSAESPESLRQAAKDFQAATEAESQLLVDVALSSLDPKG